MLIPKIQGYSRPLGKVHPGLLPGLPARGRIGRQGQAFLFQPPDIEGLSADQDLDVFGNLMPSGSQVVFRDAEWDGNECRVLEDVCLPDGSAGVQANGLLTLCAESKARNMKVEPQVEGADPKRPVAGIGDPQFVGRRLPFAVDRLIGKIVFRPPGQFLCRRIIFQVAGIRNTEELNLEFIGVDSGLQVGQPERIFPLRHLFEAVDQVD